jgi:hypothetical protein
MDKLDIKLKSLRSDKFSHSICRLKFSLMSQHINKVKHPNTSGTSSSELPFYTSKTIFKSNLLINNHTFKLKMLFSGKFLKKNKSRIKPQQNSLSPKSKGFVVIFPMWLIFFIKLITTVHQRSCIS